MSSASSASSSGSRQQAPVPLGELGAQVDDRDGRRGPGRALGQHDPVVGALERAPEAVDRRRRRAEDQGRTGELGQPDRGVAGLEPRRPVALVRRVVLLVDDHDAHVRERRDDGQPRPDDDVDLAAPDPAPLVGPLAVAEARVDERDPRIEVGPEPIDERQGERDLGHEHECRAAARRAPHAIAST